MSDPESSQQPQAPEAPVHVPEFASVEAAIDNLKSGKLPVGFLVGKKVFTLDYSSEPGEEPKLKANYVGDAE